MAPQTPASFDVVVICAVPDLELPALLRMGTDPWESVPPESDDPSSYHSTTFTTSKGLLLRVVAAAPTQPGMPASAVLATKMILRFKPKLVAMVGIAAGARSDEQNHGDILAPNQTFDYGAGKTTSEDDKLRFTPAPNPLPILPRLSDRLMQCHRENRYLDDIRRSWPGKPVSQLLQLHLGPMGSGAAVIGAKEPITEVAEHWRKLIGIEMEAYGVHFASQYTVNPSPAFLCCKSISDFAANKSDDLRHYAAYTAAQFFYRFLLDEWENLHLGGSGPR